LKNNQSQLFKKLQLLPAQFKVLLSGTPLQNNVEELYNLLEFLDKEKFNVDFRNQLSLL